MIFGAANLKRLILYGVVVDGALIVVSLILTPTALSASKEGVRGTAGAFAMLGVYALLGVFSRSVERKQARILAVAVRFGGALALIFAGEILAEYLFLPGSHGNERFAYAEFGGMFLCLLSAGWAGAKVAGRIWYGVLAAVWSTIIGSLAWVGSLLSTYCIFLGTDRQQRVLDADQVLEDFQRSGMTDLRAFVLQDYLGGVFFHLLLGLMLAVLLGALGGAARRLVSWLRVEDAPVADDRTLP